VLYAVAKAATVGFEKKNKMINHQYLHYLPHWHRHRHHHHHHHRREARTGFLAKTATTVWWP